MKRLVTSLLSVSLLCTTVAYGQKTSNKPATQFKERNSANGLWQAVALAQAPSTQLLAVRPDRYQVYRLNETPLRFQMFNLASEPTQGEVISLPMPDGSFRDFKVWQTPMMDDEMASRYPDIRTFTGHAVNDQRVTAKFDFTLFGFHAVIFDNGNTAFIDPYDNYNDGYYIVHYKKDETRSYNNRMRCEIKGDDPAVINKEPLLQQQKSLPALDKKGMNPTAIPTAKGKPSTNYLDAAYAPTTNGTTIRTYRIAVAANNFYCQAATGLTTPTIAQCLSKVTTTMNRVNGVYNREFSVQMNFATNEDQIIWPTATGSTNGSDPFNAINSNASSCISQNQTTCDTRVGTSNYDIGHVFTTGAGGLAMLGVVCNSSLKAEGVTGSPSPVGDGYDIDYVAHEIGHEFGSNHTFNNNGDGSCTGNASSANAYEPASGATIMDYAGICSPDNIQPHSDPYFSGSSVIQISSLLSTSENVCAVSTPSSNVPATLASFTAIYNIPYKTPFELTGPTAVPGAADTAITYGWFQWNRGDFGARLNQTFVYGPIFRSFQPVYNPTRIFPQIDSVLKGNLSNAGVNNAEGEKAPDTTRYLTFRMAVRAIMAGNGAIRIPDDTIHLNAYSTGASNGYDGFKVTSQGTTGILYTGGSTQTVTWNVVGTNLAPVSAANVDIYMSTDGGYTWPYTIGTFPNTGTASVTIPSPASSTSTARIKVKGNGNVFFNINSKNFSVNPGVLPVTGTFTVCVGGTTTLADASPTGTWSSSTTSVGTVGSTTGIVSGISAGTTTITYTTGAGNATAVVTVNAAPATGTITGTASVCTGNVTTLSHITGGGTWTSSNTAIATVNTLGQVTGASAGTTTISYTMTNGCGSATAIRVVTVNAPTTVSPITGAMTVCIGSNITLSDATASGTWSSASPAVASADPSTGAVIGVSAGTAVISYAVTNGFGCVSNATAVVTVNAPPSTTITPSGVVSICTGATATLSAVTGTGITYQWQSSGADIAGATNSTFTTTTAGNYTARVAIGTGCSALSPVVTVNVLPGLVVVPMVSLAASPGTTLCSSSSTVIFTPTPTNGGAAPVYDWYVNGTLVGSGATYSYLPANGDIVKVILTSNAACASPDTASSNVTMTVLPLATPSVSVVASPNDTVCVGSMVTFSPNPLFGGSSPTYTWTRNGAVVGTGLYYSYAPPVGQDTVVVSMVSNYSCLLTTAATSTQFMVTGLPALTNTLSITASATTITPGTPVTFIATAAYTGTYQWYINGAAVPGATSTSFVTSTLTNGQVVTCRVTAGANCVAPNPVQSNLITISVKSNGNGIADYGNAGNYNVMPNPNKGTFVITGTPVAADDQVNITLINMLGQTVYKHVIRAVNGVLEEHITLEDSLANGMYLVRIVSGNDNVVFHVSVDR